MKHAEINIHDCTHASKYREKDFALVAQHPQTLFF